MTIDVRRYETREEKNAARKEELEVAEKLAATIGEERGLPADECQLIASFLRRPIIKQGQDTNHKNPECLTAEGRLRVFLRKGRSLYGWNV